MMRCKKKEKTRRKKKERKKRRKGKKRKGKKERKRERGKKSNIFLIIKEKREFSSSVHWLFLGVV
jgi:hypothetical protein